MDDLIGAQNMGGSHTGTCSADIERFRELYEFSSGGVCGAQEDRHLQTNARGPS